MAHQVFVNTQPESTLFFGSGRLCTKANLTTDATNFKIQNSSIELLDPRKSVLSASSVVRFGFLRLSFERFLQLRRLRNRRLAAKAAADHGNSVAFLDRR